MIIFKGSPWWTAGRCLQFENFCEAWNWWGERSLLSRTNDDYAHNHDYNGYSGHDYHDDYNGNCDDYHNDYNDNDHDYNSQNDDDYNDNDYDYHNDYNDNDDYDDDYLQPGMHLIMLDARSGRDPTYSNFGDYHLL